MTAALRHAGIKHPMIAIFWESWMLTRWAYISRLIVVLVIMLATSLFFESRIEDRGEPFTEDELGALKAILYSWVFCIALSGLAVGYSHDSRNGFPFRLGFSRPVPTWALIIIPMIYRSTMCTALYLIPLLLANLVYEMPALMMWSSLLIVPISLMITSNAWWTEQKGIHQLVGWVIVYLSSCALFYYTLHFNSHDLADDPRSQWTYSFSFSSLDIAILLLVSAASIVLSLAGVERQRHGDQGFDLKYRSGLRKSSATDSDWFVDLYQTQCPTTSARRAELWYEINGRGVPVIIWSVLAAISVPMLWFLSNLSGSKMFWSVITLVIATVPFAKGTPTFSILIKQGNAYMSTFDATRALSTGWLAGVKIGVATISMLVGMLVVAISFWFSAPLIEGFIELIDVFQSFLREYIESEPIGLLALSFWVALIQFLTMVAYLATLSAVYAVFSDRLTFTLLGLIIWACILPIIVTVKVLPLAFLLAHVWLATGLIAALSIWAIYAVAKQGLLTFGQIGLFISIWVLYACSYFYLQNENGLFEPDVPVEFIVYRTGICLLSLGIFALAPWSLAAARHR